MSLLASRGQQLLAVLPPAGGGTLPQLSSWLRTPAHSGAGAVQAFGESPASTQVRRRQDPGYSILALSALLGEILYLRPHQGP